MDIKNGLSRRQGGLEQVKEKRNQQHGHVDYSQVDVDISGKQDVKSVLKDWAKTDDEDVLDAY